MTKETRKASITIADLEAIHEHDLYEMYHPNKAGAEAAAAEAAATAETSSKYSEHSEIFEDMCHEAEHEDMLSPTEGSAAAVNRRGSITGCSDDMDLLPLVISTTTGANTISASASTFAFRTLHQRRHSSYESRNRSMHRIQHQQVKDHLSKMEDKHHLRRASFVTNLLQFNLSVDMSMSAADFGGGANNGYANGMPGEMNMSSPAMHLSCPVLSYMNDVEEDSVELLQMKRPGYDDEDMIPSEQEGWETLNDDGSALPIDGHNAKTSKEYVVTLPPLEVEGPKKVGVPKRRRHSYKVLEEKLAEGTTPLEMLKAWNNSMGTNNPNGGVPSNQKAPPVASVPATAVQPKTLEQPKSLETRNDGLQEFNQARGGPVASRSTLARGA